jgi:hypothetical protein
MSELLTRMRTSKLPGHGAVWRMAVRLQGRYAQEPGGQTFDTTSKAPTLKHPHLEPSN